MFKQKRFTVAFYSNEKRMLVLKIAIVNNSVFKSYIVSFNT